MPDRECSRCGEIKREEEFYTSRLRGCIACHRKAVRDSRERRKVLSWKQWQQIPEHTCSRCKEVKLNSEFHHGNRYYCRSCAINYQVEWLRANKGSMERKLFRDRLNRAQNPEKWHKYWQDKKFSRYGVTREWFDARLSEQHGVCAICGRPETGKHQSGNSFPLCIDHNHSTGQVRGLLCRICNNHLHSTERDNNWPRLAVAYLDK